jgi:hypothetical protein
MTTKVCPTMDANAGIQEKAVKQEVGIVPAGIFHRLVVCKPSLLIAITAGHNTVHEKG